MASTNFLCFYTVFFPFFSTILCKIKDSDVTLERGGTTIPSELGKAGERLYDQTQLSNVHVIHFTIPTFNVARFFEGYDKAKQNIRSIINAAIACRLQSRNSHDLLFFPGKVRHKTFGSKKRISLTLHLPGPRNRMMTTNLLVWRKTIMVNYYWVNSLITISTATYNDAVYS